MKKPYDPRPALLAIVPTALPGEPGLWWPLQDVCQALHAGDPHRISQRLDPADKRRVYKYAPGWRSRFICCISLRAVEQICTRCAAIPRHEIMAALARAAAARGMDRRSGAEAD